MRINRFTSTIAVLIAAASSAQAQSIQCGQKYTVQAGDYLTRIAGAAYGDTSKFTFIYSANSETIGPNPGQILVGQRLMIPCLDAPLQGSTANASAITNKDTTEAIPAPSGERPVRILTASGWAPFLDEEQEQGGMLTEIVNLAMENSDGKPAYKIDFINDDGAHLNPLLVDHAYDLSIGWSRPDCDDAASLKDESLFRCNNLIYSDPIFEDVDGFYNLTTAPALTTYEELRGKSICRPEGYSISSLEKEGMAEPAVTIVRADTVNDCVAMVVEGKAEVALVSATAVDPYISSLPDPNILRLNEALNDVDILYTVTAKTNPRAEEIISEVNSGLRNIKDSGVWFETVRRHMTEFRASGSQ